jgi:archaellum component FlaC
MAQDKLLEREGSATRTYRLKLTDTGFALAKGYGFKKGNWKPEPPAYHLNKKKCRFCNREMSGSLIGRHEAAHEKKGHQPLRETGEKEFTPKKKQAAKKTIEAPAMPTTREDIQAVAMYVFEQILVKLAEAPAGDINAVAEENAVLSQRLATERDLRRQADKKVDAAEKELTRVINQLQQAEKNIDTMKKRVEEFASENDQLKARLKSQEKHKEPLTSPVGDFLSEEARQGLGNLFKK